MAKKHTGLFTSLAAQYLAQNTYYAPMGIKPADLVKAYGVVRETDYYGNYDNEEGHNYRRGDLMANAMGSSDVNAGGHYFIWTVLAESFDDYLKKLLREEIA